jgi:hypothetical protein
MHPIARPSENTPSEQDDRLAAWRRLACHGYAALDMILDSTPNEARRIALEAASELEGGIAELDAEGRTP